MGEKSFMEASTEISNYVGKIEACKSKIAGLLAEAVLTRTKTGKTGSLAKDIDNALTDLSDKEKADVLTQTIVMTQFGKTSVKVYQKVIQNMFLSVVLIALQLVVMPTTTQLNTKKVST